MNSAQINGQEPPGDPGSTEISKAAANSSKTNYLAPRSRTFVGFLWRLVVRLLRGEERSPSILRNNTNLPVFLAIALGISVVCNLALKESSAQASRYASPYSNLSEVLALIARNPDDPELHSRLGEIYLQRHNYKRAMFHFRESSRLSDLYGE